MFSLDLPAFVLVIFVASYHGGADIKTVEGFASETLCQQAADKFSAHPFIHKTWAVCVKRR